MEKLLAWGQYLHWADLQFARYISLNEKSNDADRIGIVAHWLASEYIVLEGWNQLGFRDNRIEKLLLLYPDHCDILRRCRNAVYHFQNQLIDKRIETCLKDEHEELQWSVVLHFEFQRYLLCYSEHFTGTQQEKEELSESIISAIGWSPTSLRMIKSEKIKDLRQEIATVLGDNPSQSANELRELVDNVIETMNAVDAEPMYHQLKRIHTHGKSSNNQTPPDA